MSRVRRHHRKGKVWDRSIPDAILLVHGRRFSSPPSPPSLRPGLELMEAAVIHRSPVAWQIIHAWRFAAPVVPA
jgi:hypothetical protein